jgi:hypothetical protein
VRAPLIAITLLACPVLGCGKIQAPDDLEPPGSDQVTSSEINQREEVAPSSPPGEPIAAGAPVEPGASVGCNSSPPPLVLQGAGGEQTGAIGSFCIGNAQLGCGLCVDRALPRNESVTLAHPGDELTISMPGARLMTNPRCTPACSLEVVITPAICFEGHLWPADILGGYEGVAQRTVVAEDEPWALAVPPGLYFAKVAGGEFAAPDGWSGEASGTFALLVDAQRERASLNADAFYAECLASNQPDAGSDAVGIGSDAGAASDGG